MAYFAQSHLQLYQQLQESSYSEEDLILVDKSYQLAMRLFAGHYRPNNKPFLMHLVGVASILAFTRQPSFLIATGLLHSAYTLGLRRKGSNIKLRFRNDLINSLGETVEQLLYAYSNRRWSTFDFTNSSDFQSYSVKNQQLYIIKLADIHEEFLDAGHLFQPRKKLLYDENKNNDWLHDVAKFIKGIGFDTWAIELQNAIDEYNMPLPSAIMSDARSSFILAPGWFNNHFKNKLVKWLSQH